MLNMCGGGMVLCLIFWLLVGYTLGSRTLKGIHFRVVAAELEGVYHVKRGANGSIIDFGGPTYKLLHWLSERLDFTYQITTFPVLDFGRDYGNGSYSGLMGHIQREESDIALGAFAAAVLEHFLERSFPWATFDFTLLIPYPTEKSKIWAAFQPFQLNVWLALLLSSVSFSATVLLYKWVMNRRKTEKVSWSSISMYLLGVGTAQGGYLAHKGRSLNFLAAIWCTAMFVVVSAYSGLLISFLSTTSLVPIVDSIHDLAKKTSELDIFIFKNSEADRVILGASSGDLKTLGDYLRQNPSSRVQYNAKCLEEAYKNHGVCITAKVVAEMYTSGMRKQKGQCQMSRSKMTYFPIQVYLMFDRRKPYHRTLNRQISVAAEMGLLKKWYEDDNKVEGQCFDRKLTEVKNYPLRLKDLSSAFLILGVGVTVAFTVFLLEMMSRKF